MTTGSISPILDHLWQSTLFALAVSLLVLLLRRAQARTRYALWLAASMKFFVPFALFMAVGTQVHLPIPGVVAHQQWSSAVTQVSQPFTDPVQVTMRANIAARSAHNSWMPMLMALWAIGAAVVLILWFVRWRRIRAIVRQARPFSVKLPVRVLSSPSLLEPSIFGIFRPILLLPEGIEARLTVAQLQSIYAHELCHVQRRDNLAAALHMLVEALFWFHPLVWWLENRLLEERERACDEAVLQSGNHPRDYAESILEVCKLCLASPLSCASGVTGANLKKRIESIMICRLGQRLSKTKKMILATAGALAIVCPIAIGLLNTARAQEQPAQTFEVASIKPSDPAERRTMIRFLPNGRFAAQGITAKMLIAESYDVHEFQIANFPKWADSDRYDIEAKAEGPSGIANIAPDKISNEQIDVMVKLNRARLQSLLESRYQLKFHTGMREMPVYELVLGKGGPKLQEAKPEGTSGHRGLMMQPGELTGRTVEMKFLADHLSRETSRVVIDKTGLTGRYDFVLHYTPERPMGPPPDGAPGPGPEMKASDSDASSPTLITALQEQLGLKLRPAKGPVEVMMIDHIEKPSPN